MNIYIYIYIVSLLRSHKDLYIGLMDLNTALTYASGTLGPIDSHFSNISGPEKTECKPSACSHLLKIVSSNYSPNSTHNILKYANTYHIFI